MEESTRTPPRLIKMDSTDRNVLERSKIWLQYEALIFGDKIIKMNLNNGIAIRSRYKFTNLWVSDSLFRGHKFDHLTIFLKP